MIFEDEVFAYIRHDDPSASIIRHLHLLELPCNGIYIPNKNIIFHLIPVSFAASKDFLPDCFQKKTLEFIEQGIQLIHLWQDVWIKNQKIVCSRIAALLDKSTHIHARQTTVQRIRKDDMYPFFEVNHLQGPVKARFSYGLYINEQLVALASFSTGRTVTRDGSISRSFELLRYANLLQHRVVGGLGKLIAHFIKEHHPGDIMTYADLDWSSGKGYRALHFRQVDITPPQMFWVHPAEMTRYYSHRLPLQLTEVFIRQNKQNSMDLFLLSLGYIRIYNAGNLKYIKEC